MESLSAVMDDEHQIVIALLDGRDERLSLPAVLSVANLLTEGWAQAYAPIPVRATRMNDVEPPFQSVSRVPIVSALRPKVRRAFVGEANRPDPFEALDTVLDRREEA